MTLRAEIDGIRRAARSLGALLLALLVAVPAIAAGPGRPRPRPAEPLPGRSIALSIRIAQARNRPAAKKYFQSLARQQKAKHGRKLSRPSNRLTGKP